MMTIKRFFQIGFFFLLFHLKLTRCELYTALADMEELLETETVLIGNLEGYLEAQENKLDFLRKKMKEYQSEHTDAASDITAYLSNPINAYLLTKRLTTDWKQIENFMTFDVGSAFLENITNYRNVLKFPSDEDLNGAAVALMRLQDTYKLDTSSVARGILNGVQYRTKMSSSDCFELGRQSYLNEDYYHTILWMSEAMEKLTKEEYNQTTPVTRADILEYLAFSTYKQGNVESALSMTNELLDLMPNHERAIGNKQFYEKEIAEIKSDGKNFKGDPGSDDVDVSNINVGFESNAADTDPYGRKLYEALCRGEVHPPSSKTIPLRCKYVHNNIPFLFIGPLKVEEANLSPYIVIYRDVMYDSEIELIKKLARPRFRRATVQNSQTGELEIASYRISKSAWLKDDEHYLIGNVVKRVRDMTGLTLETAEELQVVNYGIGGHYDPHFDFARREEKNAFKALGTGNRIATVLFYMSDVDQGGATVFPELRLSLWPRKGSAAFWFNLHASGEGDYRTRHAACPVLTGSKWVSNKWIHERSEEFTRPCKLYEDHFVDPHYQ